MHKITFLATICALPVLGLSDLGCCATFKTLHQFTGGLDGANSTADLVVEDNKLFGTTVYGGGPRDGGTVFSIDLATGTESVVYSFYGPTDGGNPHGGLLAWKGALYGVTSSGGSYGEGEAFKFVPASATMKSLYGFGGPDDAAIPEGDLIEYKGELYGTSSEGGYDDEGALFELDPKTGVEHVMYAFDDSNGMDPAGKLLEKDGLLFGVTSFGQGTVFSYDPISGALNTLSRFSPGILGSAPAAGLIDDGTQLLGTAAGGGSRFGKGGHGTVFSINPRTDRTRRLHGFPNTDHDGETPESSLLLENGIIYGTTSAGGRYGKGTVFQLTLSPRKETVLHDFKGGDDGADPVASLTYSNGVLYGTTYDGGKLNYGTVFAITP